MIKILPYEERKLCECGCGKKTSGRWDNRIKGYVRFLPFHHIRTKEYLEKLAIRTKKQMTGKNNLKNIKRKDLPNVQKLTKDYILKVN